MQQPSSGRFWLGFLDTCPTEALIIRHGQVFEKAQGRKPREKNVAVKGRRCLWGLKRLERGDEACTAVEQRVRFAKHGGRRDVWMRCGVS